MSVTDASNRVQYDGDDSTTSFPIPFLFLQNSWVKGLLTSTIGADTLLVEGVDYTLTGATVATGGTAVLVTPPATGERLTWFREAPYNQLTTYEYSGSFPADANEDTVDKGVILAQQNKEIADNLAITYPQSEPISTSSELPDVSTRKGKYLFFNASTGSVSVALTSSVATTLLDEDDMISDLSTVGATQQSIKAYVDNEVLAVGGGDTVAPATHAANLIPRWNGTPNSKTLVAGLTFRDEDNMSSDDATGVPSQQSVKAYAMNFSDDVLDEDDLTSNSATKVPTQQSVKAYVDAAATGTVFDNYSTGLITSKSSATVVGIAVGQAMNTTNALLMDATSAFTKNITGTWIAGTGNAGLDTGTIANDTWYHLYLIAKTDGTIDYLFSTSATSPTMTLPNAAGFTLFRRIGSMLTDSTPEIINYVQTGRNFEWDEATIDVASTPSVDSVQTLALSTPLGLKVTALVRIRCGSSSSLAKLVAWNPVFANKTSSNVETSATANQSCIEKEVITNVSSQIKYVTNGVGQWSIGAFGWRDDT